MSVFDMLLGQVIPGFDMENVMTHAKSFADAFQQIATNIKIIQESQARSELKLEEQTKSIEKLQHLIITGEFHDCRNGHNPDAYFDDQFRNDFPNRDRDGSPFDGDRIISGVGEHVNGGSTNSGTC